MCTVLIGLYPDSESWGARVFGQRSLMTLGRGLAGRRVIVCISPVFEGMPLWRSYMPTGKVKWFNDQKGFGFIQSDEGGPDVFVHYSVIRMEGMRTLAEGQPVEFEFIMSDRGLKATQVKPMQN